jgi:DNA invertase Pin-like site-specific DNA recombinase
MIEELLSDGIKIVVIESLDRLARSYMIQEQILLYLVQKNINVINAMSAENITEVINNDPLKKAIIQIQGVFAELDKALLVRKLKKGRERKRKLTGKCEGRKPHYRGSDILKEIRRLRKKPYGIKKRKTYKEVAEILNQRGYVGANGNKFTGNNVAVILFKQKRK